MDIVEGLSGGRGGGGGCGSRGGGGRGTGGKRPAAAAAAVADEGNKKRSPPSVSSGGSEHMIFKNKETGDVCTGTDDGRVADSLLDRYRRFVGFAKDGDEEDRLEGDQYMQQMVSELRVDGAGMIKSFDQVVTRVAQFERFIQKFHPKDPFTKFMLSLGVDGESTASLNISGPRKKIEVCALKYIRKIYTDLISWTCSFNDRLRPRALCSRGCSTCAMVH
jgi:hypothetical protein